MNGRLWYPQLDVYDCVRRLGALLYAYVSAPGIERLYIVDFYLANPPLLYRSRMNQQARRAFNSLKIPRAEKTFLEYPAPPLLFSKMEPIQKEAMRALTGKGLLSIKQLRRGFVELTEPGQAVFRTVLTDGVTNKELALIRFLTEEFADSAEPGAFDLRKSTGLRRAG